MVDEESSKSQSTDACQTSTQLASYFSLMGLVVVMVQAIVDEESSHSESIEVNVELELEHVFRVHMWYSR